MAEMKNLTINGEQFVLPFAPAGYGLGEEAKELTSADNLDDIWQNGNYYWTWSVPQNAPVFDYNTQGAYGYMRVDSYQNGVFTQTIRSYHAPNAGVTVIRTRTDNNTIVEWDNPPMKLGVEYRTTERCEGKPVYALRVQTGDIAANSVGNISLSAYGIGVFTSMFGSYADDGSTLNSAAIAEWGINDYVVHRANPNGVYIKNVSSNPHNFVFTFKYTKA